MKTTSGYKPTGTREHGITRPQAHETIGADAERSPAASAVSESFWQDFRDLFRNRPREQSPSSILSEGAPARDGETARSTVLTLLALVFSLSISHTALAQTWQTVDNYQYVAGQSAVNSGLAVAPSGVVYACGFAADGTNPTRGLVMASGDAGNTWSAPIDDFFYPGMAVRNDGGIVSDSAGNLYVAGRYYGSTGAFYRFVRRSTDGGATWATVDTVTTSGYAIPLAAGSITPDATGNVYVTEPIPGTWTVRKGIGGTSFSTVDTFQPAGSQAQAVFAHPTAGVFAVGSGTVFSKNNSSQAWVVRRSLDGGVTWSTVDTYQAGSGQSASAYGMGGDAHGNLYVVGRAFVQNKNSSTGHWQVRKSANGGTSWTTVDDYQLFNSGNQVALGFTADANGNLFVAGWASVGTGTGPYYWIVRESLGGTGAWTTVDNVAGEAHAIAADNSGHVFVGGQGPAWVVRKN
jgi:hypothetical protein